MADSPLTHFDDKGHAHMVDVSAKPVTDRVAVAEGRMNLEESGRLIRFYEDGVQTAQFDRFGAWQVNPNGTKVLVLQGGWTNTNGPFPTPFGPDRAHRIILSAWVGAPGLDAATIARGYDPPGGVADFQVDWVRVYER